jgi:hypothetical protein
MTTLHINMIRRDGGTQMRVELNNGHVETYAERMEAGDKFPPVVVFHDGSSHWLADGFHRVAAAQKVANDHLTKGDHSKWAQIDAEIKAGTRQDAIRHAISANKTNGLRRTNADKQIAVRAALAHPEMKSMSDQLIADEAGVSRVMVLNARQVVTVTTSTQHTDSKPESKVTKRTGVDGKTYPVRQKTTKASPAPRVAAVATKVDVDQRASTATKHRRTCPTCNGEGYINE